MPGIEDVRAAVERCGPHALLTGLLPAAELRLRWVPPPDRVQLLVPAHARRTAEGVQVRRTAAYDVLAAASWQWHGIPVAPPARIVLDAALGLLTLRDVRGVVLGAVADRITTVDQQLELLGSEPRNGTALVRRGLRDARVGAASPPEAEVVDALRGCRVPFLVNPDLWIDGRFLARPDGYFPGLGAGWEVDSRERHDGDVQFDETMARHTVLAGAGLAMAHLTPRRLRGDPQAAAGAILEVARARRVLPPSLREPPGLTVVARGPLLR